MNKAILQSTIAIIAGLATMYATKCATTKIVAIGMGMLAGIDEAFSNHTEKKEEK